MSRVKFDVRYNGLLSMGYDAKDISNRNLDEMMYSGVFYGYNIVNAPDINYVQVIVTRHSDNWVVQECKNYIDRIYLRSYKDGDWGDWTELVVSHNCNEPDKEFIIVERPHSHQLATPQTDGFMSAEDKRKLDNILIGGIDPGPGIPNYEEDINSLNDKVSELEKSKANVDHNHDSRYLTAFSQNKPINQNIVGQVWIELNN